MPQQFVVPQFIDVEDKIIGPITTRQFLIILAAGILLFIIFRLADFVTFIIATAIIGGAALLFAFVKINGQAFHYFILNLTQTQSRPRTRIWNKVYTKQELDYLRKRVLFEAEEKEVVKAKPRREHIRDLTLIVNTGGFYRPEDELIPPNPNEGKTNGVSPGGKS